eukprot:TRINITY_DN6627_c0_g1_i11.p1 TRINITY_DN6627_c0_g1~~TRINITY_DN6627_c0_g1_i11.p1  ORF type:complete len:238 (+),score=67.78 TRINITY_DN6627_c0_g1_i11:73-786(+)
MSSFLFFFFFFQAEDGIRDAQESRGLGDVYKRQVQGLVEAQTRQARPQVQSQKAAGLQDQRETAESEVGAHQAADLRELLQAGESQMLPETQMAVRLRLRELEATKEPCRGSCHGHQRFKSHGYKYQDPCAPHQMFESYLRRSLDGISGHDALQKPFKPDCNELTPRQVQSMSDEQILEALNLDLVRIRGRTEPFWAAGGSEDIARLLDEGKYGTRADTRGRNSVRLTHDTEEMAQY